MAATSTARASTEPTATIAAFVRALRQGPSASFSGLTLVPLFGDRADSTVVSLEHAMRAGHVTVTELSHDGDVNCLRVTNTGPTPVLLFDGEELVGAKQNRIVNTTILVPAARSIDVPVSCVEQGRWSYRSASFATGTMLKPAMRRTKTARITRNLRTSGTYDADQCEVWREVADYAARRGARSETGAYADVVATDRATLTDYVGAFPCADGQTGIAGFLGGHLVAVDVVSSPATYASLHRRLVEALAAEALDRPPHNPRKRRVALSTAFAHATGGDLLITGSPGLGTDVRLESPRFVATALLHTDQVVHLALFPRSAA